MEYKRYIKYTVAAALVLFLVVGVIALTYSFLEEGGDDETGSQSPGNNSTAEAIDNFAECEQAGYPVMESFPRQCSPGDGRVFVEEIDTREIQDIERDQEYYGQSTFSICSTNTDCSVGGCNGEICGSADGQDDAISICLAPEGPLPSELGYSCGCVNSQCQWEK